MIKRNYIDDMVDIFGYDYVIGYCLCSEHDLINRLSREEDKERKEKFTRMAKSYARKAEQLLKERIEDGL